MLPLNINHFCKLADCEWDFYEMVALKRLTVLELFVYVRNEVMELSDGQQKV